MIRLPSGERMAPTPVEGRQGFLLNVYNRKALWAPPVRNPYMNIAAKYVESNKRSVASKSSVATKRTLANVGQVWYDCKCGRQTRQAKWVALGRCTHGGFTFTATDNGKGGDGGL